MNPASVVLESRCPQTANADPSVSFQPGRTSKTPVGSSVRAAYEHPRGRTKAPSRTNGTATPIPAGTITTRPRANSSRWTPARRPPVRQRKPATVWPWRTDEDEAAGWKRAPTPIGVGTGVTVAAAVAAITKLATSATVSAARRARFSAPARATGRPRTDPAYGENAGCKRGLLPRGADYPL